MKKGKRLFLIALLVVVCLGIWVLWGNAALEVNEFEVEGERIPGIDHITGDHDDIRL